MGVRCCDVSVAVSRFSAWGSPASVCSSTASAGGWRTGWPARASYGPDGAATGAPDGATDPAAGAGRHTAVTCHRIPVGRLVAFGNAPNGVGGDTMFVPAGAAARAPEGRGGAGMLIRKSGGLKA